MTGYNSLIRTFSEIAYLQLIYITAERDLKISSAIFICENPMQLVHVRF